MKTSAALLLFPLLVLAGCSRNESAPPKLATASILRPLPSLGAFPDASPPPGPEPNAFASARPGPREEPVPTFPGESEAERLTWALRAYYDNPKRPAVSSFEPLVAVKLLRNVPVPPPGKKYVIDMKLCEVRLENR